MTVNRASEHGLKLSEKFQGWLLSGLVGWAVIEVVAKRMVKPEIEAAQAGDMASGQLIGGAVIELLVVAVVFGLMTARPF